MVDPGPAVGTRIASACSDGKEEIARMEHLLQQQVKQCEVLLQKSPKDEMLLKSIGTARSALTSLKSEIDSDDVIKAAMQSYTQSVLDSTYHEECQLVEQEFPVPIASKTVTYLITSLAKPAISCRSLEKVATLLGTELLECVYWRVGSLMYMYCHSLMEGEGRRKEVDECLIKQYCSVGVAHLELMLSARSPLNPEEDYICNDTSVKELLQKGIFSDVHMLALMYAGELCYWGWSVSTTSKKQSPETVLGDTSKAKSADTATSSAVISSLPREEDRTIESAKSSENTATPSSGVVQPTEVATSGGVELSTNKSLLDYTSTEKTSYTCYMDSSRGSVSNSETGLERIAEDLSLQDAVVGAIECSNCASNSAAAIRPERQLYSVMEYCQGAEAVENWKARFDPLKRGQELLSKFVEVARGPLKTQGWNYGRAVQLLVAMRKAQH